MDPPAARYQEKVPEEPPPPYDPSMEKLVPSRPYAAGIGFQHPIPPPRPPATTVITRTVVLPTILRDRPVHLNCPFCHADIYTSLDHRDGTMTHMAALLLCFFGFWPCCILPYCCDMCRDVDHFCPNCNRLLGTHHR